MSKRRSRIVLASGSPRRRDLLSPHFDLRVLIPQTDESPKGRESPRSYVRRVALNKWKACLSQFPGEFKKGPKLVVSADTIVSIGSEILGKPSSQGGALKMLRRLSGKKHQVITGACVGWSDGQPMVELVTSFVVFRHLSDRELKSYLKTQEWRDKAGAYGIQGAALDLVDRLEGSLTNVVGLPLKEVLGLIVKSLSRR